jgi:hypothetical protein
MGEAPDRVKDGSRAKDGSPEHAVRRVSGEIDTLRDDLGNLVSELDRRRHELFDLGLQARRHPVALAVAATVVALAAGGLLALVVRGRRRRRSPSVRARETRLALGRLLDHPDRVGAEPTVGRKIGIAVGTLVATTLAKRLLDRTVKRPPKRA